MLKYAGWAGLNMLVSSLQNIMNAEIAPTRWSDSITIRLYKGNCDTLECGKYGELLLLEHWMINRLFLLLWIDNNHLGFTAGKSTTEAILIL